MKAARRTRPFFRACFFYAPLAVPASCWLQLLLVLAPQSRLLVASFPGDGSTLNPAPPDDMPRTFSHSWYASRFIRRTTHLIWPFFLPAFRRRSSIPSFLTLRSERSRKSNPVHASRGSLLLVPGTGFYWFSFPGNGSIYQHRRTLCREPSHILLFHAIIFTHNKNPGNLTQKKKP